MFNLSFGDEEIDTPKRNPRDCVNQPIENDKDFECAKNEYRRDDVNQPEQSQPAHNPGANQGDQSEFENDITENQGDIDFTQSLGAGRKPELQGGSGNVNDQGRNHMAGDEEFEEVDENEASERVNGGEDRPKQNQNDQQKRKAS